MTIRPAARSARGWVGGSRRRAQPKPLRSSSHFFLPHVKGRMSYPTTMGFMSPQRPGPWHAREGIDKFLRMTADRASALLDMRPPPALEYSADLRNIFEKALARSDARSAPLRDTPASVAEAVEYAAAMLVGRVRMRARLRKMEETGSKALVPRGAEGSHRQADMFFPFRSTGAAYQRFLTYQRGFA